MDIDRNSSGSNNARTHGARGKDDSLFGVDLGTLTPWLTTFVGLLIIAVVSFGYFLSKGYQSANQKHEAENAQNAERESHYQSCIKLPSIDQVRECAKYPPVTSRSEERAEKDLNAQREMADWAESMLWTSVISIMTTAVGIFFVWRTLAEARATTRAAIEANELIRNEQRPWVHMSVSDVHHITVHELALDEAGDNDHEIWFSATVILKNSGKTPAQHPAMIYYSYSDSDLLRKDFLEFMKGVRFNHARGATAIPPGSSVPMELQFSLPIKKPPDGWLGGVHVHLLIGVEYDTLEKRGLYRTAQQFFVGTDTGHATLATLDFHKLREGTAKIRITESQAELA